MSSKNVHSVTIDGSGVTKSLTWSHILIKNRQLWDVPIERSVE